MWLIKKAEEIVWNFEGRSKTMLKKDVKVCVIKVLINQNKLGSGEGILKIGNEWVDQISLFLIFL